MLFEPIMLKLAELHIKLRNRDKSLAVFKHYYDKLKDLKRIPNSGGKEAEKVARVCILLVINYFGIIE